MNKDSSATLHVKYTQQCLICAHLLSWCWIDRQAHGVDIDELTMQVELAADAPLVDEAGLATVTMSPVRRVV